MAIIKLLSGLAFIGSVAWFISQPNYESAIATVSSLATFIGAWLHQRKVQRRIRQSQTVASYGVGIQAGGDVATGNVRISEPKSDAE